MNLLLEHLITPTGFWRATVLILSGFLFLLLFVFYYYYYYIMSIKYCYSRILLHQSKHYPPLLQPCTSLK